MFSRRKWMMPQDLLKCFEEHNCKTNWLFSVRNSFYKSFKAKSQRGIRFLYSCESILIFFAPFYVNSSCQNRFKCWNVSRAKALPAKKRDKEHVDENRRIFDWGVTLLLPPNADHVIIHLGGHVKLSARRHQVQNRTNVTSQLNHHVI